MPLIVFLQQLYESFKKIIKIINIEQYNQINIFIQVNIILYTKVKRLENNVGYM